ncbi:helix-turn-helix domain-containing protein [Lacunimicrobium album]
MTESTDLTTVFDGLLDELAKRIVLKLVEHLDAVNSADSICFTEEEAAKILRLEVRQLADERREKKITFSRIRRDRVRYSKADLVDYIARRRVLQ